MGIQQWANRQLGMRDTCTAISFDTAVMTWGIWVENRINEIDDDGNHPWSLEQILGTGEINNEQQFAALRAMLIGNGLT